MNVKNNQKWDEIENITEYFISLILMRPCSKKFFVMWNGTK